MSAPDCESQIDQAARRIETALAQYHENWRDSRLAPLELSDRYDVEIHWQDYYPNAARKGCYFLLNAEGELLYVGKASFDSSLGKRIGVNFRPTDDRNRGVPVKGWTSNPRYVLSVPVSEPFEASSLEEFLIQTLKPKANILGRKAHEEE